MDNIDGLKGMQKAHGVGMDTATLFSLEELFCFVLAEYRIHSLCPILILDFLRFP